MQNRMIPSQLSGRVFKLDGYCLTFREVSFVLPVLLFFFKLEVEWVHVSMLGLYPKLSRAPLLLHINVS